MKKNAWSKNEALLRPFLILSYFILSYHIRAFLTFKERKISARVQALLQLLMSVLISLQ